MRSFEFPSYPNLSLSDGLVTETGTSRPRTVSSHAADGYLSIRSFDAVEDDATDVQAAFQVALDTAATQRKGLLVPNTATGFFIGGTGLVVPNGTRLVGEGIASLIKAHASLAGPLLTTADEADDIWIEGLYLDCDEIATHGFSSELTSSSRIRVNGCTVLRPTLDAIKMRGVTDCRVDDNHIIMPGQHGVVFSASAQNFVASGNRIIDPGGAGIIFMIGINGAIFGNRVNAPGDAGDGITGYSPDNHDVIVSNNVIDAAQNHGIHVGGTRIIVEGNTVNDSDNVGIFIQSSYDGSITTNQNLECIVDGNTSIGALYGLICKRAVRSVISNNVIKNSANTNIQFQFSHGNMITGNISAGTVETNSGYYFQGSARNVITNNISTGHLAADGFRFDTLTAESETQESINNTISSNISYSDNRGFIETGSSDNNWFFDNRVLDSQTDPGTFTRVGSSSKWHSSLDDPITIPSASSLNVGYHGNVFFVTGTTSIANIAGACAWTAREITLVFRDAVFVSSAGNIKLNGGSNWTTAYGNTLRLVNDSVDWREVGRGTGVA